MSQQMISVVIVLFQLKGMNLSPCWDGYYRSTLLFKEPCYLSHPPNGCPNSRGGRYKMGRQYYEMSVEGEWVGGDFDGDKTRTVNKPLETIGRRSKRMEMNRSTDSDTIGRDWNSQWRLKEIGQWMNNARAASRAILRLRLSYRAALQS